jgi:peptidoglycan biosynthesis protein MviN/MurJ (putative lipid II flippase)
VVPQVFGKTRLNLYVAAIAMISNTVLSLALLRVIGILGPATAFVCSSYLSAALYFIVTKRLLRATARQLLPLAPLVRTAIAAGLAILPALWAAALPESGLVSLTAGAGAFAVGYAVMGYFLGVFNASDIYTARSWIRRLVPA